MACEKGGPSASCGVSTPWVEVVNHQTSAVEAQWDGGKVTTVPPNSTRFVDNAGVKAGPPYHLVIRNPESGAKVAELTINVDSGPEAITLTAAGSSVSPTTPPTTPGAC